jgi:hypothetical protein
VAFFRQAGVVRPANETENAMTPDEIERFAIVTKLAERTAAVVKEQARTLQLFVEITGQVIAACPGFSDEQKQDVGVLLAQIRGSQAAFQSDLG